MRIYIGGHMTEEKRKDELKCWIERWGGLVLATALRLLKNRHDAEDVFQNTFIKAYTRSIPFKSPEHLKAWLIRVASNECISLLRSSWKSKVDLLDVPEELCGPSQEKYTTLKFINSLPKIYSRVLYLYYFCGYSTDELSEIEGVSPSAVRSRLERARAKLKCELERMD